MNRKFLAILLPVLVLLMGCPPTQVTWRYDVQPIGVLGSYFDELNNTYLLSTSALTKLDATGKELWQTSGIGQLPPIDPAYKDHLALGRSFFLDGTGGAFIASGVVSEDPTLLNHKGIFAARILGDGTLSWQNMYIDPVASSTIYVSSALSSAANLYTATESANGFIDILQYDQVGNISKVYAVDIIEGIRGINSQLRIDTNDNLYLFNGEEKIVKFSDTGQLLQAVSDPLLVDFGIKTFIINAADTFYIVSWVGIGKYSMTNGFLWHSPPVLQGTPDPSDNNYLRYVVISPDNTINLLYKIDNHCTVVRLDPTGQELGRITVGGKRESYTQTLITPLPLPMYATTHYSVSCKIETDQSNNLYIGEKNRTLVSYVIMSGIRYDFLFGHLEVYETLSVQSAISKYDSTGTLVRSVPIDTQDIDLVNTHVDDADGLTIAGWTKNFRYSVIHYDRFF